MAGLEPKWYERDALPRKLADILEKVGEEEDSDTDYDDTSSDDEEPSSDSDSD